MILKVMTSDGYKLIDRITEARICPGSHQAKPRYAIRGIADGGWEFVECPINDGELVPFNPAMCEVQVALRLSEGEMQNISAVFFRQEKATGCDEWSCFAFQDGYLMSDDGRTVEHIF